MVSAALLFHEVRSDERDRLKRNIYLEDALRHARNLDVAVERREGAIGEARAASQALGRAQKVLAK
jgi:hypothetical protein